MQHCGKPTSWCLSCRAALKHLIIFQTQLAASAMLISWLWRQKLTRIYFTSNALNWGASPLTCRILMLDLKLNKTPLARSASWRLTRICIFTWRCRAELIFRAAAETLGFFFFLNNLCLLLHFQKVFYVWWVDVQTWGLTTWWRDFFFTYLTGSSKRRHDWLDEVYYFNIRLKILLFADKKKDLEIFFLKNKYINKKNLLFGF